MTNLMQDNEFISESRFLKTKLSQDVKTMMIYRQSGKVGKDPFSKMVIDVSSEGYQDGIQLLDTMIDVFDRHGLPGTAFLLQAKARFLTEWAQDYPLALEAIDQALVLARHNNFVLFDTRAQIKKKEMKNIMNVGREMTKEAWYQAFSAGTHAYTDFIKAQELYAQYKLTCYNGYSEMQDCGDITFSHSPSIFGEVETSLMIAELLLERLCTTEEDQNNMRACLQLQNVRVEYIFEEFGIFNHEIILPHIVNRFQQISDGMDKIIKILDPRPANGHFDQVKELRKLTQKFEDMFFESYFGTRFLGHLHGNDMPPQVKVNLVEKYIEVHHLKSFTFVRYLSDGDRAMLFLILTKFKEIVIENDLTMTNSAKMAFLNLDFSLENHEMLRFETAQMFSLDLARRRDERYENYFFHLLLFITDKSRIVNDSNSKYDEMCIVSSVEKIREIRDAKSWKTPEGETKYDYQEYLYYLTTKAGFERINHFEQSPHLPDAAIIDGKIVNNLIEMELPQGSTIKIRPSRKPYFLRKLNTKYVTFEMVFALNGLVAWNVKAKYADKDRYRDLIQNEKDNDKKKEKRQAKSNVVHPSPEDTPTRYPHPSGEDPHSHEEVMENLHINPDPESPSNFRSTNSIFTPMDFDSSSLQYRTRAPDVQPQCGQPVHQNQQFRHQQPSQQSRQPVPNQQQVQQGDVQQLQHNQVYQRQHYQLPEQHRSSHQPQFQQQWPNREQLFQQHQQVRAQVQQQQFQQRNPGPIARPARPPQPQYQTPYQDHFPPLGSPQTARPRRPPPPGFNGSQGNRRRDN